MVNLLRRRENPRSNWVKDSTNVGLNYLNDNEYIALNRITLPLYSFILERYPNEPKDAMDSMDQVFKTYQGEWLFIGINSLPLAIEMSQWNYDVHFVYLSRDQKEYVENTMKKQNGIFESCKFLDDYEYIANHRLIVHSDLLNDIKTERDVFKVLDKMKKRCFEVLFSVRNDRDWKAILDKRYKVEYIRRSNARSYFRLIAR